MKVFIGVNTNHYRPTVMLVNGRKVVSISDEGQMQFLTSLTSARCLAAQVGRPYEVECFVFETEEQATDPVNLWDMDNQAIYRVQDMDACPVDRALSWLADPLMEIDRSLSPELEAEIQQILDENAKADAEVGINPWEEWRFRVDE